MSLSDKYFIKTTTVKSTPGHWDVLLVDVYQRVDGVESQIGQYNRNYSDIMRTFCPFIHKNKEYALYSKDHTSTRIMELPSCKDIGGEKRNPNGFCPVDYFVPYDPESGLVGDFGFIAGCYWGDDIDWKIQFLDLSNADIGVVKRDNRFGRIELPRNITLEQAINTDGYWRQERDTLVRIAVQHHFEIERTEYYDDHELDEVENLLIVRLRRKFPFVHFKLNQDNNLDIICIYYKSYYSNDAQAHDAAMSAANEVLNEQQMKRINNIKLVSADMV